MGIFEYKQLDYLIKLYEGKMNITDKDALDEYKRLCGEYGNSVIEKLGVNRDSTPEEMLDIASKRKREWNARYQITYYKSHDTAELYHMLSSSYSLLSRDIQDIVHKIKEATSIIQMSKSFLYGGK